MPRVQRSIVIEKPVHAVYTMVADHPERMAEWWPPIELQERVTPPPTGIGSVSRYVYNMLGVRIKGEHRIVQLMPDQHLLVKTISGIDSTFEFTFVPENDAATRLTIVVDYQLPGAIIGQLLNKVAIENENIKNLEKGLEKLKDLLERDASPNGKT
jgi:uncharacterized membrane protein